MTPHIVDDNPSSYDLGDLSYLDNLPAYNAYEGSDRLLDLSREIFKSGAYYPLTVPWPQSQAINIAARGQLSGSIIVPASSILVGISGWSDNGVDPNTTSLQFMLRLFDSATGKDIFYGTWGWASNIAPPIISGLASNQPDTSFGGYSYEGYYLLSDPYVTLADNSLQATVLNGLTTASNIQVALHFAVPYNSSIQKTHPIIQGVS